MRHWSHEPDLAKYLRTQRAIARARAPATPTMPHPQLSVPNEDLHRIDRITKALHNLQLRLSASEELMDHAARLIEYLHALQSDLQIQSPDQAFTSLQQLRDLIFWLPPQILRPGESDLEALTLLAHLYASALALEPLCPGIGGAYLGSMSFLALEKIQEIMRTRLNTQPQDTSNQVALSLMEVPLHIMTWYCPRQRHNSQSGQSLESYRYSPQANTYAAPHMPMPVPSSTTDGSNSSIYSNSPLHAPGSLPLPGAPYFQAALGPGEGRRESSISSVSSLGRAHSMSERSLASGSPHAMSMVYGSPSGQQPRSSHEMMGSRMDYFGQIQAPYHPYGGVNMNTRFVTPSQLWT